MTQIIIIHPGSLYLRIGKASDLNPEVILNCIARRRKSKGAVHHDSILPDSVKTKELIKEELDEARLNVSHTLQNCLQSNGRKRYGTPSAQLASFNKRVSPEIVNGQTEQFWLKPKDKVSFVVGADVLRLDPNGSFNVHFPIRRGEFNIHKEVGGSITSVLEDMKSIWEYAIRNYLDINLRDLHQYKAVLIIPDVYSRKRVKEMTAMIFKMGFSACLLGKSEATAFYGSMPETSSYSAGTCGGNIRQRLKLRLRGGHRRSEDFDFLRGGRDVASQHASFAEVWRRRRHDVLLLAASESFVSIQGMPAEEQPGRAAAAGDEGIVLPHRPGRVRLAGEKLHHQPAGPVAGPIRPASGRRASHRAAFAVLHGPAEVHAG